MPAEIFNRHARPQVLQALMDTRVVFISGARQVGKSTLGRGVIAGLPVAEEFSMDRRETRESALSDPEGFIAALRDPVLIDEGAQTKAASPATIKSPGRCLRTSS